MPRVNRRGQKTFVWSSAALLGASTAVEWFKRQALHELALNDPALVPAVLAALPALVLVTAVGWSLASASDVRRWRSRTALLAGLPGLSAPPWPLNWLRKLPDPFEVMAAPIFRSSWGAWLAELWEGARPGSKPSRFLAIISAFVVFGYLAGSRIAGPVLGLGLALGSPLVPIRWAQSRLAAHRRTYDEQLPMALDALASGLAAGLSFQQSIAFAAGELPQPLAGVLGRVDLRLRLGRPLDQALSTLLEQDAPEMMALAVEGIRLQRQYGGDLVRMLNETAALLRERLELEREVRAVTSQGRLSGAVVAGLVPVSAGLLLLTNPRYIDVLFNTLVGQLLLVTALALQLAGWGVMSRLVRIHY